MRTSRSLLMSKDGLLHRIFSTPLFLHYVVVCEEMVSEVAHRAGYDLSEWRSIATLLADARKRLSSDAYPAFYAAVTAYSRSRGTDTAALAEIESVLSQWGKAPTAPAVAKEAGVHDADADAVLAAAVQEAQKTPEVRAEEKPKQEARAVTLEEAPQKLLTIDEAKARILVIKNEIHELIGNPVALIGDMGSLGKDYMKALLGASRATMGGAGGGLMPAMRALEDAYEKLRTAAIEGTVPAKEKAEPVVVTPPEAAPLQEQEEALEKEPEKVRSEESHAETRGVEKEAMAEPVHYDDEIRSALRARKEEISEPKKQEEPESLLLIKPEVTQERSTSHEVMEHEPLAKDELEVHEPTESKEEEKKEDVPLPLEEVLMRQDAEPAEEGLGREEESSLHRVAPKEGVVVSGTDDEIEALRKKLMLLEARLEEKVADPKEQSIAMSPETSPQREPAEHRTEAPAAAKSVAPSRVSRTVQKEPVRSPRADTVVSSQKAAIPTKEIATFVDRTEKEKLYQSEAVTEGLRSLLMSWEIFRGGFLSGKERGREHPLYKTMREVVMSDILSGKFQGAKTNVVISANDYVNAWRFEQGIEYNPAETFEHYLRRIVHRILTRAGEL